MRFVLVALVALFVCFSVIPMKQKHYMLPLLPLLAILLGHMLHALYEHDRDLLERFVRQLGRAVVVAAPILAVLSVAHLRFVNDGSIAFAILVASLIIAFGALGFTTSRRGRLRGFVAASLALFGVVNLVSLASFEIWRDRFKADAFAEIPDFDAAQWQVVFERNPVVRNIYQASRWRIEDGAAAPTETLRQDL